ncbi:hypothetical protein FM112_01665 [Gulosibacter sp. 10]|nr:hypothetical protein FM112_01665 [Gulosibacter sp. 10]
MHHNLPPSGSGPPWWGGIVEAGVPARGCFRNASAMRSGGPEAIPVAGSRRPQSSSRTRFALLSAGPPAYAGSAATLLAGRGPAAHERGDARGRPAPPVGADRRSHGRGPAIRRRGATAPFRLTPRGMTDRTASAPPLHARPPAWRSRGRRPGRGSNPRSRRRLRMRSGR